MPHPDYLADLRHPRARRRGRRAGWSGWHTTAKPALITGVLAAALVAPYLVNCWR
jgi:hypothetical protein